MCCVCGIDRSTLVSPPTTPHAQTAEKGKRTNLLAALGLAVALYNDPKSGENGQQGVRRARRLFGKVLSQYPACPADVRLGFGLCCYRLGEVDRARAAFQRCVFCLPACLPACLNACLPACLPACLNACLPMAGLVPGFTIIIIIIIREPPTYHHHHHTLPGRWPCPRGTRRRCWPWPAPSWQRRSPRTTPGRSTA